MELRFGNPSVGDQMRELDLPSTTGEKLGLNELVGKPLVLVFSASEKTEVGRKLLSELKKAHAQFAARGIEVVVISLSPVEALQAIVKEQALPFPMLSDPRIEASAGFGALRPEEGAASPGVSTIEAPQVEGKQQIRLKARRRTLLVRPSLHIAKIYDDADPDTHVEQILKDFDQLIAPEPPRQIVQHAPVLLIPNVIPPELCRRLIQMWEEQGNVDSGFMKQIDGQTVGQLDYSHKIRRDHFMKECPELDLIKRYLGARVIPRIKQAFNYDVSRFEDFRIACYDAARGGYFRPHRDNTTAGTAHRRFAMSLLLNDDYDGGSLRFPEFGLNEYRPEAGSAVIFSCSLLHEAMDVKRGLRFVLLTFLYGEKEAKIREEYNVRTGGTYRA